VTPTLCTQCRQGNVSTGGIKELMKLTHKPQQHIYKIIKHFGTLNKSIFYLKEYLKYCDIERSIAIHSMSHYMII